MSVYESLRPDVLVLAAGGVVGEAWMTGVLAGIEDSSGLDFRRIETLVGTSAGSIVAASLAAGRRPRRPGEGPAVTSEDEAWAEGAPAAEDDGDGDGPGLLGVAARGAGLLAGVAGAPFAPFALRAGAPAGALARAALLARVPAGRRSLGALRREVEGSGVRFDGRLRICALDRERGRRVVFGAPGSPPASVGEAVEASCAVPGVFRPVTIGGREYVDGGAWSITNLDIAPVSRDTHVLCLTVAGGVATRASAAGLIRLAARPAAALEAAALRSRGAHVEIVGPDAEAAEALGGNLLDPRGSAGALRAGHRQGLRI